MSPSLLSLNGGKIVKLLYTRLKKIRKKASKDFAMCTCIVLPYLEYIGGFIAVLIGDDL